MKKLVAVRKEKASKQHGIDRPGHLATATDYPGQNIGIIRHKKSIYLHMPFRLYQLFRACWHGR